MSIKGYRSNNYYKWYKNIKKNSIFCYKTISRYDFKYEKWGTEQCIYLLWKEGEKSENMSDVFGKDAQEMNKPPYRLDRDKIQRELLYYVTFLCCLEFWTTKIKESFLTKILFQYQNTIMYRSLEEGNGNRLQYSCLENPVDGGAWWAIVHGVTKSRTWLSDFTFTFHFHALEKEMTTHSSVLAWSIPGTGSLVGCYHVGSHRVGHNWCDLAAAAAA